jgi:hypothetical protein
MAAGNLTPCTNYATTYTSLTLGTPCANTTQVVLQGSSTCQATSDAFGNLGVYTNGGTYSFTLTSNGVTYGPYTVTLSGNGYSGNLTITASQPYLEFIDTEAGGLNAWITDYEGSLIFCCGQSPPTNLLSLNLSTGLLSANGNMLVTANGPYLELCGTEASGVCAYLTEYQGAAQIVGPSSTKYFNLGLTGGSAGVLSLDGTNPILGITPATSDNSQKVATTAYVNNFAVSGSCGGVTCVQTLAANSNTVGSTSACGALHTYTASAGQWNTAGKTIRFHSSGDMAATNSGTFSIGWSLGGTTFTNDNQVSVTNGNQYRWDYEIVCSTVTTGATGTMNCTGKSFVGANGGGAPFTLVSGGGAVVQDSLTLNLTGALTLTELISCTNTTNFAKSFQFPVEQLN